jgi:two-component system, NarL family, nitrate/nitrite response regulator NarL
MTEQLNAIRVFVVAGVLIHREALGRLLDGKRSLGVIGTGPDADAFAGSPADAWPDVVLVDTATVDCPAAIQAVRRVVPGTKVLALGVPESLDELLAYAEAGVSSYVTREQSPDELVAAIESAARGEALCSPRVAAALLERIAALASERGPAAAAVPLTAREQEIIALIDLGLSNKQIARELYIELATVKNHVHHILAKLKVTRRADAAARWRTGAPALVPPARAHSNNGLTPAR